MEVVYSVVTKARSGVKEAFKVVSGAAEFDEVDGVGIIAHHVAVVGGQRVNLEVQQLVKVDIAWADVMDHGRVPLNVGDFAVAGLVAIAGNERVVGVVLDDDFVPHLLAIVVS